MEKTNNTKLLGQHMRSIRKSRKLTIVEICQKLGWSKSYLMDMENGLYTPNLQLLVNWMKVMDVTHEPTRSVLIMCLFSRKGKIEIPMEMISVDKMSKVIEFIQKDIIT